MGSSEAAAAPPASRANSTTQQRQQESSEHDNPPPPDYDTLSLAPPGLEDTSSTSHPSFSHVPNQRAQTPTDASQKGRKSLKQQWEEFKQEDGRRKPANERYETVSAAEADRITGLDKHRALEEKKAAERKRGGKSMLGMLMLA
ncbi:hypothetical protein LTR05_001200 [Lithohypha guttulata]|uniref:Uncharacterized protein n=1 Tax=Lithohypha guttulata TaxID=1690604 RepID=A0AAN7YAC4_9EURO|nr:hypothetical protein LTR05_001200 [Lithohypha guttulata]